MNIPYARKKRQLKSLLKKVKKGNLLSKEYLNKIYEKIQSIFRKLGLNAHVVLTKKKMSVLLLSTGFFFGATDTNAQKRYVKSSIDGFSFDDSSFFNPTLVDIDNDGDLDVVCGSRGDDFELFTNIGSKTNPSFRADGSLDVLRGHSPSFIDLDNDGDLDFIAGESEGTFSYFENIGTLSSAMFASKHVPGLTNGEATVKEKFKGFAFPFFADMDGDGDYDLVSGAYYNISYFENIGSIDNPEFSKSELIGLTDVFTNHTMTPVLADIDDDGDLDVFAASAWGNLFYFNNNGMNEFSLDNSSFPELTISSSSYAYFLSSIAMGDLDGDSDLDIIRASGNNNYIYYEYNAAPTSIDLSNTSIDENVPAGTFVGFLETDDLDSPETHTYSLVSGNNDTDNISFHISNDSLFIDVSPNFEIKEVYSILIQTKDALDSLQQAFSITINNLNEYIPPILSNDERFGIEFDKGCSPLQVSITNLDGFSTTHQYSFDGGNTFTTDTFFSYQNPGIYDIIQVRAVDFMGSKFDTLVNVEVVASIPPAISFVACGNKRVKVSSNDEFYDFTRVYFTDTDSADVVFQASYIHAFDDITTKSIRYRGFFENSDPSCELVTEDFLPVDNIHIPETISASIKEVCKNQFNLTFDINTYTPSALYQVEFLQSSSDTIYEGVFKSNTLTFDNISIDKSFASYCIKISSIDGCDNSVDEGVLSCHIVSSLSLSPFENLFATYTDNGVFINIDSVSAGYFIVQRKADENAQYVIVDTVMKSFTDQSASINKRYFYKLKYMDECNEILYSEETNPPLISSSFSESNVYDIQLAEPMNNLGSSSQTELHTKGNNTTTSEIVASNNFIKRLKALHGEHQQLLTQVTYPSDIVLTSNTLALNYVFIIYAPKAFTPNRDSKNDIFKFYGLPTDQSSLMILNRWDKIIFQSDDASLGWDGTIAGEQASQGTYVYRLTYAKLDGEEVTQTGQILLIR